MSDKNSFSWVRILDDAIGLIVILVALAAVLELAFSLSYALEILSLGLLAIGIAWIVWSFYLTEANIYARVFMFITGGIAVAIALIEFLLFSLSPNQLIIYPALAMLLVGVSRLVLGFLIKGIPLWIQMLQVLAGILTLNLAAFVFIFSNIDLPTMLILLVISFLANGLVRLIIGRTEIHQQWTQSSDTQ
jgi:hypothetical protein